MYPYKYNVSVRTTTEFNGKLCGPYQRTGVMCGKCIDGYSSPVYSYNLSCVECSDYKYNWLKYIVIAYLPLTLFYIVVVLFRFSATSGHVVGFITISQMLTTKAIAIILYNVSYYEVHTITKCFLTVLSIWNLDFFRALYQPFCLAPSMTTLYIFLLDYLEAVFPMALVLLTYLLVKMHTHFKYMMLLCTSSWTTYLVLTGSSQESEGTLEVSTYFCE